MSYISSQKGYGTAFEHAMPGDLIMAHASDIDHPAWVQVKIDRNYIMFGVVKNFVYVEWDTGFGIIEDHERLNINWVAVPGWDTEDKIPPPCNDREKVLSLRTNYGIDGLNSFLIDGINEHFFHSEQEGWCIM